nr:hypothetical protein [uncultured Desulfobacter sp.]
MLKKILIGLATVCLIGYIVLSRTFWFSELEKHADIAKNFYYSPIIDLSKTGTFTWHVNRQSWKYNGHFARIFLICERSSGMPGENFWSKGYSLKLKIDAYAETENHIRSPRLVINYFFPTDEPMAATNKLWAGWPDERMEYLLGEVTCFQKEELYIHLNIKNPDSFLSKANPRLKIVGDYDPAVMGHIVMARTLRSSFVIICLIALAFLTIQAIRSDGKVNSG